ncbi:hypothetical protein WDW37_11770 [Bdellovibrionota bacterium FG-1]
MWEPPKYRQKYYLRTLMREKAAQRRKKSTQIHLLRTQADLLVITGPYDEPYSVSARLILNDLTPEGVTLFLSHPLPIGQTVHFQLLSPEPLVVPARVAYCREFTLNPGIQTQHTFPYRIKLNFSFLNDGDAAMVRHYCEELERTLLSHAS